MLTVFAIIASVVALILVLATLDAAVNLIALTLATVREIARGLWWLARRLVGR